MLMRFVPFIGGYIAAIPPLLLAAVVDPGWSTFLIVLALYVVSELTMGQVVEPLVFGHGTGVSPIAVIVSTVFWTWLWGPARAPACHADHGLSRRARTPCRGLAFVRGVAWR